MKNPKREIEDFQRFKEILEILAEGGFGFVLDTLEIGHHINLSTKILNRKRETRPERLRETLEKLGPTFIKFGQMMSERPDLVPEKYLDELESLQEDSPEFDVTDAREIVDQEIGLDKFDRYDEEPIAAASIAQVHRARLKQKEVILKVRRPSIKQQMSKDLDIIEYMATKAEKHSSKMKAIGIYQITEQFSRWTKQELDLQKEAQNAKIMKENLRDDKKIRVPKVYEELTTEKVLVMEYVDGFKIDEKDKLDTNIEMRETALAGIETGINQIVRDGFFHADPHESNFRIDNDGNLVMLDFGMVGKLTPDIKRKIGLLLLYIWKQDLDSCIDIIEDLGNVSDHADKQRFKQDLQSIVLELQHATADQMTVSEATLSMIKKAGENGIYMPSSLVVVGKGMLTIEGIILKIYPEINLSKEYSKRIKKILIKQNNPKEMAENTGIDLIKNKELITKAPSLISRVLNNQNQKKVVINNEIDQTHSIIISSIIIASAILATAILITRGTV